ncbi:MAG: glycosyltransferase, partial [Synechococcaceae cyanobacterium ELA182]
MTGGANSGSTSDVRPDGRRGKAALFLLCCSAAGVAPHGLPPLLRLVPGLILALLLGTHTFRAVLRSGAHGAVADRADPTADSGAGAGSEELPVLDVVVAARDEQAVITRLVQRIMGLHYPAERLLLWVIDDGSDDRTPELLRELQNQHPQLRVLRRARDAGGGKSGARNLAQIPLQGPQHQGRDQHGQGGGRLEQQQRTAGQAGQHPPDENPAPGAHGAEHGPPEQGDRHQLHPVEHHPMAVAGQGQQGQGDGGRGQG